VLGGDRPRRTVLAVAVFLTLMSTAALIPGPRGSVSPPTMRVVPTGLQSSGGTARDAMDIALPLTPSEGRGFWIGSIFVPGLSPAAGDEVGCTVGNDS
jgi:hypothetical protein